MTDDQSHATRSAPVDDANETDAQSGAPRRTMPQPIHADRSVPCSACRGRRVVKLTKHSANGKARGTRVYTCPACLGTGQRVA